MKRKSFLFEKIYDLDNLLLAFYKAKKGKCYKEDVLIYQNDLYNNIKLLQSQLKNETFDIGHYHYFKIYDPKERLICAASFPERIVHHAIMNICLADFERYQIFDSYACRVGKGTFAAIDRAKIFTKKYQWYLKLDVRKYFDSIDHLVLKEKLRSVFKDKQLLQIFDKIIDSYTTTESKGLPIGNLTSQFFANHYLSYIDHFITQELKISAYIRYMDDMLLWSNSKGELKEKFLLLENFLREELKLTLKAPILNKTQYGLSALGFVIYPNKVALNNRSKKRFIRQTQKYIKMYNNYQIEEGKLKRCLSSLYAFICHSK